MPSGAPIVGGAAQGAAQGAAVGSVFGPVGTVAGAVIGGVFGAVGGLFSSKSARYAKMARKKREEVRLISTFLERRKLLQSYAQARSASLAVGLASGAGAESSGIQGSLGSLYTQTRSNLNENAIQIALERQASKLHSKSDTAASNAAAIGNVLNAAGVIAPIIPQNTGYNAASQRLGTGTYTGMSLPPLQAPPLPTVNTSPFIGP